jgi:hypothetical protein
MIVWNTHGFHLIDAMPKGEKYNAHYFVDNIPVPIGRRLISQDDRELFFRAGNSRCNTVKVVLDLASHKAVIFSPYFLYFPEIEPSYFFLVS